MIRIIIFIFLFGSSAYLSAQSSTQFCDYTASENMLIISRTSDDNLASNSVRKIIKTHDGYIFIATYNGISIYDGQEFTNINYENTKNLRSNSIYDFCYSKDSIIWLATQKGVSLYKNMEIIRLESLKSLDNFSIQKIVCDKDGTIWIGTASKGLYYYKNDKLSKVESLPDIEKNIVSLLYCDSYGKIWVGTENGLLYYLQNNKVNKVDLPKEANGAFTALQDNKNNYYFGTRNGIYSYKNNKLSLLLQDINSVNDIKEDRSGGVWFATNSGLFCYNKELNTLIDFSKKNILNNQIIQSVYFDKDNIMWISTYRKGLIQVRSSAFYNYPFKFSGIEETPSSILLRNNGTIWVGTDEENIFELNNGIYKKVKIKTDLNGGRIKDIFQDKDGGIWICSYGGLLHINNGKETLIGNSSDIPDNTFRYILQDKQGDYWVGTRQSGIYKITKNHKLLEKFDVENGLSSNYILSIKYYDEHLYVATKNGINIIYKGKIIKQYNKASGLLDDMVFDLYKDDDNILWAATIKGLSRIEGEKITNYSELNGLKINKIFSVAEDDYGYLWLPTIKGLMRIEKKELNHHVNDSIVNIRCAFYNEDDGIYDKQYVGATHLVKSDDGKIYFNTISGVSVLDPHILNKQNSKPKLLINSLKTEKKTYHSVKNIELPAGIKYIEFSFSYIDFINPGKAIFQYKLTPFEQEWVKIKSNRKIQFTNLSPGKYEFIIEAIPELGQKKNIVAQLKFEILPAYYQTVWFKVILALVLLFLVYLFYKIRLQALKSNQIKLENEIKIRTKEITIQKEEIAEKNEEVLLHQYQIEQAYVNLKLLSDLGREITTHLTLQEISTTVYKSIHSTMDSAIFGIGIYKSESDTLEFNTSIFKGRQVPIFSIPANKKNCLLSQCYTNSEEILIHDVQEELSRDILSFPNTSTIQAAASVIVIPIKLKKEIIGILTTQSYRKDAYSDYQFNMLSSLSVYVAIAIENSKTYKKIDKQKNELQKVNAAKDKMFSLIGHDLRGPVGTIKSFLDLILENPEMTDSEQTQVILKTMQQSLGSAYNLLDNLLLWARSQRGEINFKPSKFIVSQPIEESISLIAETAANKKIKLIKKINYNTYVYADQIMITTVIRNLVSNAIKFTPKGGKITIQTNLVTIKKEGKDVDFAEISIIDTGIGIDNDIINRILKSADTFSTLGTDKEQGSGLGINICMDFLNRHEQKLLIENNKESNHKTEGSTFKFYLPIMNNI